MNCQFETLNNLSKIKTSDFSEALVDDQGLEGSYTSLKPSKERRFNDIILIQYSKSTQNSIPLNIAEIFTQAFRNAPFK